MNDKEYLNETLQHITEVQAGISRIMFLLLDRRVNHDASKFSKEEKPIFMEYTPKLKETTYGSDEYKQFLAEMKPALDHHYAQNSHHPEHFPNGVDGMNLVDLVEMFCDWYAATKRHADGDIMKSIETNTIRFKLSPQLANILRNTVELLKGKP